MWTMCFKQSHYSREIINSDLSSVLFWILQIKYSIKKFWKDRQKTPPTPYIFVYNLIFIYHVLHCSVTNFFRSYYMLTHGGV